jgi:hypothetical protein
LKEYQETIARLPEENRYFISEKAKWQIEKENLREVESTPENHIFLRHTCRGREISGNSVRKDL